MKKYIEAHRKVDAKFGLKGFALAEDGVHPGELGHWIIAREILKYLGFKEVAHSAGIAESLHEITDAQQYVKLVAERQNMLRDAWLTATKHKRPGLPVGLPLNEAESKADTSLKQIGAFIKKVKRIT